MRVTILGSGGGVPSAVRETSCVLVRDCDRALLLDAGSGVRRLLADPRHIGEARSLDVVLTHFHYDHICGLPYLQWLPLEVTIWGPGAWLYGTATASILGPLLHPPISPNHVAWSIRELREGDQVVREFNIRTSAQHNHWDPSVGLRIDDDLAYITDTPFESTSIELARDVRHLLHEAWSTTSATKSAGRDATAADAARVAREAAVGQLTLIHLHPSADNLAALLDEARASFEPVLLAKDADSTSPPGGSCASPDRRRDASRTASRAADRGTVPRVEAEHDFVDSRVLATWATRLESMK